MERGLNQSSSSKASFLRAASVEGERTTGSLWRTSYDVKLARYKEGYLLF